MESGRYKGIYLGIYESKEPSSKESIRIGLCNCIGLGTNKGILHGIDDGIELIIGGRRCA